MDAVVKEEEDGIDVKKEVKVEEDDYNEYQHLESYEFEPKYELIDEMDVKVEEENDEYQHIIPYEYRDYMEQNIEEEQKHCSQKQTSKELADQCQKCHKYFVVKSFWSAQQHAATHTKLKKFKCDKCSYGSWHRFNVQKHINSQHKNESCSVEEVHLSLEEQLELRRLARECFPGMDENSRSIITINGKQFNSDGTPFVEKPTDEESTKVRRVTNKCQKCNKFVVLECFAHAKSHAVTHTNLKKFKCEQCNYGSWCQFNVQRHIARQHKNESCSIKEIQLSEEDHLELMKLTKECFPEMAQLIPLVYQDYNTQDIGKEKLTTSKAGDSTGRKAIKVSAKCQKCYKVVVIGWFGRAKSHAISHTNLKRFKCGQCNYGSWHRCDVRKHISLHHKNEPCSMKEIHLSQEEKLELKKLTEECFPDVIEALKRKTIVDEKRVKDEEEHLTIVGRDNEHQMPIEQLSTKNTKCKY